MTPDYELVKIKNANMATLPLSSSTLTRPEDSTPTTITPIVSRNQLTTGLSFQNAQSHAHSSPMTITESNDDPQQTATNSTNSNWKAFWKERFPIIANACGICGLLLALVFGVSQWVGQNRGNAIAKESELVTLALSCSEEPIKYTSICRQFLAKYPDGPAISGRGNVSAANFLHHNLSEAQSTRKVLEYTAAFLANMEWFLHDHDSYFQSALEGRVTDDIGDIIQTEKVILGHMASLKTLMARQHAESFNRNLTTTSYITLPVVILVTALLVSWVVSALGTEFMLFYSLGLYICFINPVVGWILLGVEYVMKLLSYVSHNLLLGR
ncbi:hypothetical protein F5Y19DRAFT_285484 [Xylariaceae sp. FL1651]|nr:hypothetical protein F5Y19DRAFT_285484 [Xylariaceae sp. FL1651]